MQPADVSNWVDQMKEEFLEALENGGIKDPDIIDRYAGLSDEAKQMILDGFDAIKDAETLEEQQRLLAEVIALSSGAAGVGVANLPAYAEMPAALKDGMLDIPLNADVALGDYEPEEQFPVGAEVFSPEEIALLQQELLNQDIWSLDDQKPEPDDRPRLSQEEVTRQLEEVRDKQIICKM